MDILSSLSVAPTVTLCVCVYHIHSICKLYNLSFPYSCHILTREWVWVDTIQYGNQPMVYMCIPVCSTGWGFFTSISSIISSRNWKTYSLHGVVRMWGCEGVRVYSIIRVQDEERQRVKYGSSQYSTVITASTAALTASFMAWDTPPPRDMLGERELLLNYKWNLWSKHTHFATDFLPLLCCLPVHSIPEITPLSARHNAFIDAALNLSMYHLWQWQSRTHIYTSYSVKLAWLVVLLYLTLWLQIHCHSVLWRQ